MLTTPVYKFTGKERDGESNLDNSMARYFSSQAGRFLSPDPSNLSVDFRLPQTWNRYSYTLNNPLRMTDQNGLWPTIIHDQIINEAFPGMSAQDLQILEKASYNMDKAPGQQNPGLSFEHSMSNGIIGQSPEEAEQEANAFIHRNEQEAREIEADWLASGHEGIAPAALAAFGNALHTIIDGTSPAHRGFQPWYGLASPLGSVLHYLRELSISQTERQAASSAARGAFQETFGDEFDWMLLELKAQPHQPVQQVCSNMGTQQICQTF